VLALLVLFLLLRLAARRLAVKRRRRKWLMALDSVGRRHDSREQPHDYLAALNRLFRAVALRAFPDTACARLEGGEWVAFLTGLMPEGEPVGALAALSRGPYEPVPEFDEAALRQLAEAWVNRYG
jgi:hypothetical protein